MFREIGEVSRKSSSSSLLLRSADERITSDAVTLFVNPMYSTNIYQIIAMHKF